MQIQPRFMVNPVVKRGDKGVALADGVEVEIFGTKKPLPDITVHVAKVKRGVFCPKVLGLRLLLMPMLATI